MVTVEYLAGFIDGDGSLSLSRIPRGHSYEYCVRTTIANTNKAILREIQRDWGGTIHSMGERPRPNWKPGFVLVWTNAAAAQLLRKVRSQLRLKSQRADVLLEFADHVSECRRRRDELGRLRPHSTQEMELREAFFRRLRQLNRKGVGKAPRSDQKSDYDRIRRREGAISPRYLAGFVDGDGSLMITKSRSVSNTDRGILEEICHAYGGTIHRVGRGKSSWKPAYMLVWTDGVISNLLSLVGPHLRLKRKQADIQLEFIQHKKDTPRRYKGRFWASHPRDVIQFREGLYQHMKRLNARGTTQILGRT